MPSEATRGHHEAKTSADCPEYDVDLEEPPEDCVWVAVEATCDVVTEKAACFGGKWYPLSQLDEEPIKGERYEDIAVRKWFANKEGLI